MKNAHKDYNYDSVEKEGGKNGGNTIEYINQVHLQSHEHTSW